MTNAFVFDRIQFFSIIFSLFIFFFIFSLVKHRRVKEEYSLLWFAMSFFLLYLSIDRHAIDRLGHLFGVAYPPSVLTLLTTGFTFLVLIHLTVVITRISDQNKELIQSMSLHFAGRNQKSGNILAIIPAYNEEKNIAGVIRELHAARGDIDILVVNDGSIDRTSPIARETGLAVVVDLQKNLGIGGAVQTGFKYARSQNYDIAFQFDGDGQHLVSELDKMFSALDRPATNVVIGSRFLAAGQGYRSTFVRRLGIRVFEGLNSLLIRQRITDNTSGFRIYDRAAIEFLAQHYPVDYPEPEAVILLGRNGFRIAEIPVQMRERQGGGSSITGLKGIYYMIKVVLAVLMTALRKPVLSKQSTPSSKGTSHES